MSYNTQDSSAKQRIIWSNMSTMLRLKNPALWVLAFDPQF